MKKTKKYVSVGKAYARANYSQINGEKKNRNIAYFKLKQSLIYPELCNAFDFLTKNTHKTRTELLIGNPLPKSYSELGKLNERPIIGLYTDKGLTAVELASEFNLVLIGIRQHKFEINLFLKYKEAYETYLLIDEYDTAYSLKYSYNNDLLWR